MDRWGPRHYLLIRVAHFSCWPKVQHNHKHRNNILSHATMHCQGQMGLSFSLDEMCRVFLAKGWAQLQIQIEGFLLTQPLIVKGQMGHSFSVHERFLTRAKKNAASFLSSRYALPWTDETWHALVLIRCIQSPGRPNFWQNARQFKWSLCIKCNNLRLNMWS